MVRTRVFHTRNRSPILRGAIMNESNESNETTITYTKNEIEEVLADPELDDLTTGPAAELFGQLGDLTGRFAEQNYTGIRISLILPK